MGSQSPGQLRLAAGKDLLVQRIAVRVNRHHGGKIRYFQFPDRFRRTELFHHINIANLLHAVGQHLRRTTDRVQIHAAEFLAGRDEYTVNIALVRDRMPAVGVVAAPALGLIWRGAAGMAERLRVSGSGNILERTAIRTRAWPDARVAASA